MKMNGLVLIAFLGLGISTSRAQSFEVQQLLLDWQKLTELKDILSEMQSGYQILSQGYERIRSITEGNFNLHNNYLRSLLAVNPAIGSDPRVEGIIGFQASILSEYQSAFSRFKQDPHFTPEEISYLGTVYNNLFDQSKSDLTDLSRILTAGELRMGDQERIHAIDGIYSHGQEQLMFLRSFNNSTTLLAIDRATEANDAETAKRLYGLE